MTPTINPQRLNIFTSPKFDIYWYDAEHTILITHIKRRWTWPEALEILTIGNAVLLARKATTYSVLFFDANTVMMPQGSNSLSYIRRIMQDDPSAEALLLLVGNFPFLKTLLETANKITPTSAFNKYRFVHTLGEALGIVADHKCDRMDA